MHISIDANGTREQVKNDVASQIASARRDNPTSQPAIAALGDEIVRRMRNVPATEFSLHVDLIVDLKVTKVTEEDISEPAITVNGERITITEFNRRAALEESARVDALNADPVVEAPSTSTIEIVERKPIIGTRASARNELISSGE